MVTDVDGLIHQYIDEDPEWREPEHARLIPSGAPVWAIIAYLRAVEDKPWRVAEDYRVPEEAVQAAIEYHRRHAARIDAIILLNTTPVA
jgi:hypothetical protein